MKKMTHRTIAGLLALLLCAGTWAWAEETDPVDPGADEDQYFDTEYVDPSGTDGTDLLPDGISDHAEADAASDVDENEEDEIGIDSQAFSALLQMGLLPEEFTQMRANQPVSRALLAGAVVQLAGFPAKESKETIPFTDVNLKTPHRDAIAYLYHAGILSGNGDNTFAPDAGITYTEAFKIMIDILGYRDYTAARFGEYPGSYLAMARQLDLTDGLSTDRYDGVLTASDAAELLYNCGITCMASPISYSADGTVSYTVDESKYLLSVYRNIFRGEGVLMDDGLVSLNGNDSAEDTVWIDDRPYKNPDAAADGLLGCRIRFFYRSVRGDDTLLWADEDTQNNVLEIKSSELLPNDAAYGYRNIVYWDGDRHRSARISSYADVVYNNNLVNAYTLEQISPNMGTVRLIDQDGDGTYDVVLVTEYDNLLVNAISDNGGYISGQYGDTLKLDDYDIVKIWSGGALVSPEVIPSGRLLSYVKSPDGRILVIYVNGPAAVGSLEAIRDREDKTEYTFSGTAYKMSYSLLQLIESGRYRIPTLTVGVQYRYHLDMDGYLAAVEEAVGALQYAYLIDGTVDTDSFSKSGSVKLRMTLQSGMVATLKTADKVKLNGEENKKGTDILDRAISSETGKVQEQIVKVAFNGDGEVKEMEFAVNVADTTGGEYDPMNFSCDYSNKNALYNTDNCYVFDSKYFVTGSTIGFLRYTNPDGSVDYSTIAYGSLANQARYDIKLYDCDSCMTASAMSITKSGSGYQDTFVLVDNVIKTLDQNGDPCWEIEGYYSGSKVKYTAEDDGTVSGNLRRGDIIQVSLSLLTKKIEKINTICKLSEKPKPSLSAQPGSKLVAIFGYLHAYNGRVAVTVNPDGSPYGKYTATATNKGVVGVSIYNAKTDTVSTGRLEDVYPLMAPDASGNPTISDDSVMVFIQRRYNYAQSVVLVYY